MPYVPVRGPETAVPDALSSLRSDLASLSSATSGQVNGTLSRLQRNIKDLAAVVDAIPVTTVVHAEGAEFAATEAGTVAVTASLTIPEGKRTAHVFASVSGWAQGDGVSAHAPVARIRVAGVVSPVLGFTPMNMDGRHLYGCFARTVAVSPGQALVIEALVYGVGSSVGTKMSLDCSVTMAG